MCIVQPCRTPLHNLVLDIRKTHMQIYWCTYTWTCGFQNTQKYVFAFSTKTSLNKDFMLFHSIWLIKLTNFFSTIFFLIINFFKLIFTHFCFVFASIYLSPPPPPHTWKPYFFECVLVLMIFLKKVWGYPAIKQSSNNTECKKLKQTVWKRNLKWNVWSIWPTFSCN